MTINFIVKPDLANGKAPLEVTLDAPQDLLVLELLIAVKQLRTEVRRIGEILQHASDKHSSDPMPIPKKSAPRKRASKAKSGNGAE